jgi:hypothetical protein
MYQCECALHGKNHSFVSTISMCALRLACDEYIADDRAARPEILISV